MFEPRSGEMFIELDLTRILSSVGAKYSVAGKGAWTIIETAGYKYFVPPGLKTTGLRTA